MEHLAMLDDFLLRYPYEKLITYKGKLGLLSHNILAIPLLFVLLGYLSTVTWLTFFMVFLISLVCYCLIHLLFPSNHAYLSALLLPKILISGKH